MKRKKGKAPAESHENSVKRFREIADALAQDTPAFAQVFAEPWPDWMIKLAIRFTNIAAPQIIDAAKRGDDEFMHGQVVAAEMQMVDQLKEFNVVSEIEKLGDSRWNFMVEQLEILAGPEAKRLRAVKQAAADLPSAHSASFYESLGDGLIRNVLVDTVERIDSSTTASICLFVIMLRVPIENRQFKNVTQLAELFLKLRELAVRMPAEKLAVRASITAQFRKICSEAGLKLSKRGRPPKNRTGEPANQ